jgi:AAA15 family ATPase/GTPase
VLESIEIKRFKSILKQRVEFGSVNLFVGGNGSGKSNLLEAIGVASAALNRGISDGDLDSKGVRLSTPAFFKSAFKGRKLPSTFRIETNFKNSIKYHFELMSSENASHLRFKTEKATFISDTVFGRSGNGATVNKKRLPLKPDIYRGMYDQVKTVQEFSNKVTDVLDEFSRYAIYAPQTEFLRGTEVGRIQSPPVGLHGEGLPQAAASLIEYWNKIRRDEDKAKIDFLENDVFQLVWNAGWANLFRVGLINPTLMSSEIKTGSETLYFRDKHMHQKRNTVTAYDSSEGILFLLFLGILIGHPESPKIFALDNVDNALNPRMTKVAVDKLIKSVLDEELKSLDIGPKQVFMTSHNPTAMDAFDIFDEKQGIFVVSRNEDGHSVVNRIKPPNEITKEKWIERSGGRSLSELWISGDIPNALGVAL